ncbi:ATP-binding cassette domain-containing protein [Nocardia brasiliensis]|uniref:ATP-binding cassette domain-containing protein n=1 Tax=Nocardia brasiliensis TaxID=37326 RepID=A0A6G9XTU4_NOCBR|nr:ABC transporter ATP-binding protein [Nocardia brasiliensis]QIS04253.1 ATP-binding cassette domain-containing protein [Nocardia brasiliensis]
MTATDSTLAIVLARGTGRIKGLYAGAMTAWTTIYALPLVIGALVARLLDRAGSETVDARTWWLLAAIVAAMALRALVLFIGLQLTFKLIFRTSAWLKIVVLGKLLDAPSPTARGLGDGETLNRLRDDTDEIGGLLEWTTDLIYRSVLTVLAIAMLAVTDVVMTLPLLLLLGGLLASVALKKRVAEYQVQTRQRQGRIGATIADTITGIRDLRLSGTVEQRMRLLQNSFDDRRHYQLRQQVFTDLLSDLFRNLVTFGTAIVLLSMTFQIRSGGFEVGKLALFITYSGWLGQQMYFFGKILARYQRGKVSLSRLDELGVADRQASDPAEALPPLHELRWRTSSSAAMVALDFSVRPGQLLVLTGEVGSGKSTLVREIAALQPPVSGTLSWNGVDVTGDGARLRPPRIAYAGQFPKFLRGTIADNLALGTTVAPDRIDEVLAAVHLRPGSAELPQGAHTRLDSGDASQLSGGQRQRLALARMLLQPADLYLIDDCDSSIDPATVRALWANMPRRDTAAWIVVSHNPDVIAAADKVIYLERTSSAADAS